jgi:eukaryotic-like serine/threonine-protein kinase
MRLTGKEAGAGQIIADRYQLKELLGHGGMARIWRAEQLRLRSQVAIKFLDPEIAEDPEMLARFLREARSAAAVRSAHVVQIFDYGVEGGNPYIAMELLDGESLDERLDAKGTLTPSELNKIFSEVARAVSNSHDVGVIHRDLKPGNIFIAREGEFEITKVLDFGIAKVMNQTLDSAARTRTGTVLGTPQYMSPEQVRGSRSLDHRTDLWSLAVIAFECLTGELPFRGANVGDFLVQICTCKARVPSALGEVPLGFDEWFLKGINKDPHERCASVREMAASLSAVLARPEPSGAEPSFLPASVGRPLVQGNPGGRSGSAGMRPLSAKVTFPRLIPTHPVLALLRSASEILLPPRRSRARRHWFSLAALLSLLCGVGVIALWPRTPNTVPAFVDGTAFPAAISPRGAALGETVTKAPRADAGTPRVAAAESVERLALGPAARWRAGDDASNGSARRSAASPAALRPRANIAEEQRKSERSARPDRGPTPSTPKPTTTPRESGPQDPFSERL